MKNKSIYCISIIFLIGSVCVTGCSKNIKNRYNTGKTIVCFGDSLTKGVGASPGQDYPSLLSQAIGRPVINAGVSGNTTADGLKRIEQDVLSKNPKLVILAFGGNDFIQRMSFKDTFGNLEIMIQRIQKQGAMVVLVGVRSGLLTSPASSHYKKLSKQYNTAYIPDILKGIFAKPSLMADGIHPNDAGYVKITQCILKTVKPLLK